MGTYTFNLAPTQQLGLDSDACAAQVKHNGQYVPCMFDYSDRPPEEQDPGPDEADQCIFEESLAEVSRRGFKVNTAAIARRNKRRSMRMRKAVAHGHAGGQSQRRQETGGRLKGKGMTINPTFREPGMPYPRQPRRSNMGQSCGPQQDGNSARPQTHCSALHASCN